MSPTLKSSKKRPRHPSLIATLPPLPMLKSISCPSSRRQARYASPSALRPPAPQILTKAHEDLRRGVRDVCARFPNEYWRNIDADRRYPEEFVRAMTETAYLGALVPEEYGGIGLDLSAACASSRRSTGAAQT